MAEPSKACSLCEKTSCAVWRIDRESNATICNPCYLKKYPRPPKKAEENGDSSKKRKAEHEAEAAAPEKEKKAKKDKKEKEVKKEEVKQELVKKEEDMEDLKVEVKEEQDTAVDDAGGDALFDIFNNAAEKKKKDKHSSVSVANQDNGEVPEVEAITSDTEYEDVTYEDKSVGVSALVVEATGSSKLDGKYDRLPKSSRGRTAYYMRKNDKLMYFYWRKGWRIGSEFGGSKSNAKVDDVKGLMDCLEPYPKQWKVFQEKEGTWLEVAGVRIYDAAQLASQVSLPEPLMEANSGLSTKSLSPEEEEQRRKEKEEKKKAKLDKKEAQASTTATAEIKQENADAPQVATQDDSSSASSSARSSSSGSDENEEAAVVTDFDCPQCGQKNRSDAMFCNKCGFKLQKTKEEINRESMEKKAVEFESKLVNELKKIVNPEARNSKLAQIKKMLADRKEGLLKVAGMDAPRIEKLIEQLERDFYTAKKAPKQPGGPPPKHLMKKEPGEGDDRAATAMPMTPPDDVNSSDPSHRLLGQPAKSALKRKGAPKNRHRRIMHGEPASLREVQVASFRSQAELWFQMPGSTVVCDRCERTVAQSQGSLQGAPGQSQFAQDEFLCIDCSHLLP